MTFLSDLSFTMLCMLPLIIVVQALRNIETRKLVEVFFVYIIMISSIMIYTTLQASEDAILLLWCFLVYPLSFGVIYYVAKQSPLFLGLKKNQMIRLLVGTVVFVSISIIGVVMNKPIIMATHEQLLDELMESDEPLREVINKSHSPATMVDIIPLLPELSKGEIEVFSYPWKAIVKVTTDSKTAEFTYVRYDEEWKLDGVFRTSHIK